MKRFVIATATLVVIVTSCGEDGPDGVAPATSAPPASSAPSIPPPETSPIISPPSTSPPAVTGDCDALLEHYKSEALPKVGAFGLGDRGVPLVEDGASDATMAAGDDAVSSPAPGSVSSTNVQVEGVDEADAVKTDGEYIYAIGEGQLRIVEPVDEGIRERGQLRFEGGSAPTGMFLHDDTIVAIGPRYRAPAGPVSDEDEFGYGGSTLTELIEIDVSDVEQPRLVRSLVIDGSPLASRLSDGVVRLVIESGPVGIDWATPDGDGLRSEIDAIEANRELIRASTIENWLPYAVIAEGDSISSREVISCDDVFVPSVASGYSTLTVLQVPVDDPLGDWASGGVVATGATVYAPADELYVATLDWNTWDEEVEDDDDGTTSIHRFETPVGSAPRYVASGTVPGRLLNQFSMDALDGVLRVATTSGNPWGGGPGSRSQVITMRQDGDTLTEVGRVGDLGKTEEIYAVRFMGTAAYVVTYRQTDPLYVLDLGDPAAPALQGELKIPGFSNYLHPAGDGRLLGIGQAGDDQGRTLGLQLALFDVRDPLAPVRTDTHDVDLGAEGEEGEAYSAAQDDHHAFTVHDGIAIVPFEGYWWNNDDNSENQRTGFVFAPLEAGTLDGARTVVTGSVSYGEDGSNEKKQPFIAAQRSVGIDGRIYGLGYQGVVVVELASGEVVQRHEWRP
jgi:hypothetical protein